MSIRINLTLEASEMFHMIFSLERAAVVWAILERISGFDVPHSTSYGVYISQLIRFARVSSHVADFNARNKSLTAKLLQQVYRYHKLRKTFSKFYRRHYELVSKFNVGLKTLLHQGLSEPQFYGDLIYKLKKKCRKG